MGVELVIGIAIGMLCIGLAIGYLLGGRGSANQQKIDSLEAELEASQSELSDYREEVLQQFSDTADKFKSLDESYHALHRQLAASAVTLIGDQGTPLLTSASEPLAGEGELEAEPEEKLVEDEITENAASNDEESCLLYTSPSPRDREKSRMPSSA